MKYNAKLKKKHSTDLIAHILLLVFISSFLYSCAKPNSWYINTDYAKDYKLEELFQIISNKQLSEQERYAVTMKIGNAYSTKKDYQRLISFLSDIVTSYPNDSYNAQHLLSIAWAYSEQNAEEIANLYYERIVKNYPDLIVNGKSIHCTCLKMLIKNISNPERRIEFRRELLSRFSSEIDKGSEYYLLGNDYEAIGDWNSAISSYKSFLPVYKIDIPGHPDAIQYAQQFISLATAKKDWTYEALDDLLNAIKQALINNSAWRLGNLRAKAGFFAMDWYQDKDSGNSNVLFDFNPFMINGRVHMSQTLEPNSNSKEAYVKTWGWSERVSTWYLYFRKIDFPADPEIHGQWEWAGIYFGEKVN